MHIYGQHKRFINIAILLVLALGLRLYAINETIVHVPLRADAGEYYSYALNLTKYGVYSRSRNANSAPQPDAYRSPAYPLSIVPFVSDPPTLNSVWNITLLQAILDAFSVLLAYAIFRNFISEKLSFAAAILVAISPHLISATTYVLSETLFTFLLLAAIYLIIKSRSSEYKSIIVIAGIFVALAALTRPTLQFFLIPTIGLVMFQYGWRSSMKYSALLFAGFLVIYSPWTIRNIVSVGSSSDSGLAAATLYHGIYPNLSYKDQKESMGFPYRFDPNAEEIAKSTSSILSEIARRFKEEPMRHLTWYLFGKTKLLFSWNIIAGQGDVFIYPTPKSPFYTNYIYIATHFFMRMTHWLFVLLALLASISVWIPLFSKGIPANSLFATRLLSLLMLYYIAIHTVGAPFPRYSIPLRPFIYGLAIFIGSKYFELYFQNREKWIKPQTVG